MKLKPSKKFNFIKHLIEASFAFIPWKLFKILSPDRASNLAGWLGRKVIPIITNSRKALNNLKFAFPENTEEENKEILKGVYDNLGRIIAEYLHLSKVDIYNDSRFEVKGIEIIDQLKNDGKPAIIFGAHLASWEVAIMALNQRGVKTGQMYRKMNNPYVDKAVMKIQSDIGYEVLRKGAADAKKILELLKRGDHLFILVDQKHNRGIPVSFFGKEAMTAPAAARLAMKFKCPFVPAQVERLDGFRFRITIHPPLELQDTGHFLEDITYNLTKMNQVIEGWVRQHPEQWLWLHNRWPKSDKDIRRVRFSKAS